MINENENEINKNNTRHTQIKYINSLDEYSSITKNVTSDTINVLIFTADWCGPCIRMKPFINETILKYTNQPTLQLKSIQFLYINIDSCLTLSEHFNISILPTLIITQNNKEVYRLLTKNINNLTDCLNNLLT